MEIPFWLPVVFFFVALIYSMMGFGGGSSYLAFLVLAGLPHNRIAPLALICNLIVTSGALWHFRRAGFLKIKKVLPFIALSIPMAYLGGRMRIGQELFHLLLGCSLLAVALRMALPEKHFVEAKPVSPVKAWSVGLPSGALLGFLAGIVGIGGGIFLSPLLILMRWLSVKEAAAAASLFIVVNSFAGLMGQFHKGVVSSISFLPLGFAVFVGGQIGAFVSSNHLPKERLQQILAGLIFYVSMRLLWGLL